jgi:D-amino peptidase
LLAADMNAVIDGLFAGGATEVHVVDGHGSTNPEPDLRADLLDPRAIRVERSERFDPYIDIVEPGVYDAVAVVGMHAKAGSGGFASHTITFGIDVVLNESSITETELVGLSWGEIGVPVIFASGDNILANDVKTMPWLEFVVVKDATGPATVVLRPIEEARSDLRSGAKNAIENLASARLMKINTPVAVSVAVKPPGSIARLTGLPGIHFEDDRLTFVSEDFAAAYAGIEGVVGAADFSGVLFEQMFTPPDGKGQLDGFIIPLINRWLDVESDLADKDNPGDLTAPDPTPEVSRKYHGFQ